MLTQERITELAHGVGVKTLAVENFLSTLGNMSRQEAMLNCEMDAQLYRWNHKTQAAIQAGIREHFA